MARPALAADRALDVIDLLVQQPGQRFTLTEIGRSTGVNPASLHALLAVLERKGFVERHPHHRTYGLGAALVAAGTVAAEQHAGLQEAARHLDRLSADLGLEIVLTAPAGVDIIVVSRCGHHSEFGSPLRVGQRLPLNPPLGTVFLAWAPEPEIGAWLGRAHPPLGPDEVAGLRRQLDLVQARGYAVALESEARRTFASAVTGPDPGDIDQLLAQLAHSRYHLEAVDDERTYDVVMTAAPVFDEQARVAAAITASGFAPAQSAADIRRVADALVGAATVITKRTLGRQPG